MDPGPKPADILHPVNGSGSSLYDEGFVLLLVGRLVLCTVSCEPASRRLENRNAALCSELNKNQWSLNSEHL